MALNQIPVELWINNILPYVVDPPMKLLDWIDIETLNWFNLSHNSNAVDLLITYGINKSQINKIFWGQLSLNTSTKAIELLKENQDKINWNCLSQNTNVGAIKLLESAIIANIPNINLQYLSFNPIAVDLMMTYGIHKGLLNRNWLSCNPSKKAIELLKSNPNKIDWCNLSRNPSVAAIDLLKANPNKINWSGLSLNPSAPDIDMLKANPDKIDWSILSSNPSIFEIDYKKWDEKKIEFYKKYINN